MSKKNYELSLAQDSWYSSVGLFSLEKKGKIPDWTSPVETRALNWDKMEKIRAKEQMIWDMILFWAAETI